MSDVIAVVEGQTEQTFVQEVLAPWLADQQVFMTAAIVGKPGHKGGVRAYESVRGDLLRHLKQRCKRHKAFVTMMFDYYAMPASWPGRDAASSLAFAKRAPHIELAIHADVVSAMGSSFDSRRFIPYVQMHEFEALLFVDPAAVCNVLNVSQQASELTAVRESVSSPEEINDRPDKAPSKRIERALGKTYQKPLHGVLAVKRIGIEALLESCPHFAQWVERLVSTSAA